MLSKIPYINRLFKNVAIGRETNTLMMTVTPCIIIPEEEEEKYLGSTLPKVERLWSELLIYSQSVHRPD